MFRLAFFPHSTDRPPLSRPPLAQSLFVDGSDQLDKFTCPKTYYFNYLYIKVNSAAVTTAILLEMFFISIRNV